MNQRRLHANSFSQHLNNDDIQSHQIVHTQEQQQKSHSKFNSFNIIMNQMKKEYKVRGITQQKISRKVKPQILMQSTTTTLQPKIDQQTFTSLNYPHESQTDVRPIIKKKLLFLLYKILTKYSEKKSSLSNQQRSIFVYLVLSHQIQFLYPLANKLSLALNKKKIQNSNEQITDPQIEEEEEKEELPDIIAQVNNLRDQLAKKNDESSFEDDNIIENPSLAKIINLSGYDTPKLKLNQYHHNVVEQKSPLLSLPPLMVDVEQYYQQSAQLYSPTNVITPSTIVHKKNSDYQLTSTASIDQQINNRQSDLVSNQLQSVHNSYLNQKDNSKSQYVQSQDISQLNSSSKKDLEIQKKNVMTPSPDKKQKVFLSINRQPRLVNTQCISIDDQLDTSLVKQPPTPLQVESIASDQQTEDEKSQSKLNQLQTPQNVIESVKKSEITKLLPNLLSAEAERRIKVNSESLSFEVKLNKIPQKLFINIQQSDQPVEKMIPLVVPSSQVLQQTQSKLKTIEQDEEEFFVHNKVNNKDKLKPLNNSKRQKDVKKPDLVKLPSKQSILDSKQDSINLDSSSRQQNLPKLLSPKTDILSTSVINSSLNPLKNTSSQFRGKPIKKPDNLDKSKGDPEKKKKNLILNTPTVKTPYEKKSQSSVTSDEQLEEEYLQADSPQIGKKLNIKQSRNSLIPKKNLNNQANILRDQEIAKNKELEFLKQYQKLELERTLGNKYSKANSLIDKRNMIEQLISQLEIENVPEVKYQIYLYRQRLSQIKNQQSQMNEAIENQINNLPDCYDYMSNLIDPKQKNKFKMEDEMSFQKTNNINLKFSDNIRTTYQKNNNTNASSQIPIFNNPTIQEHNDYSHQNYNASDKQNEKELMKQRRDAFQEETLLLKQSRNQDDSFERMRVIQSRLDVGGTVETVIVKSNKLVRVSVEELQFKALNQFERKINKSLDQLKKLSSNRIWGLNEKFQRIKYIAKLKEALVDQTRGITSIKISL